MDTQNTRIHARLWHKEFWFLAIANMLLATVSYFQFIEIPVYLYLAHVPESSLQMLVLLLAYAGGLYLFGPFCSWLVQRYRRGRVCLLAILLLGADVAVTHLLPPAATSIWIFVLLRFLFGALYGITHMILSSTLIPDVCESSYRTDANHAATWFARFALPIAPTAVFLLYVSGGTQEELSWRFLTFTLSAVAMAFVLILLVRFPFRTPDDSLHLLSLDRFLLPHSYPLFFMLLASSFVMGYALTLQSTLYPLAPALVMCGFLMALLAERFVFANADLRSEAVSGYTLMVMSLLITIFHPHHMILPPILLGFGGALMASRFMLFFIKLSPHCQRGTSQSTFFLGWESGISIGLGCGLYTTIYTQLPLPDPGPKLYFCLAILAVAMVAYQLKVHNWYLQHKNR